MTGLYLVFSLVLAAALLLLLLPLYRRNDVPKRQRNYFIAAVVGVFFLGAFGLYYELGSPHIVPLLAARQERLDEVKMIILKRTDDLKTDPKNLGAWVELGESFMETGQFSAAKSAFKQAVVLSGGNPALILAYAQAMISESDGKVTDDAKKALEMVVLQTPDNAEARYWLIVRQLQDGQTQEAMAAMKALYHSLPDNSPVKAMIDQQIGRN